MKRTIDIMTTARAKGVELPAEWFYSSPRCPRCNSSETEHGRNGWKCTDLDCGFPFEADGCVWTHDPSECPDLELPENIHHAFTVADALAKQRGREPVSCFPLWTEFRCMIDVPANIGASATERHLALVAACEAALGIERGRDGK